ncbi:hypothetical protein [Tissierella sp.]|uniref:hypothetical protein n=1 Tax=Tissierella sp. TaxID=41274 RepID=UPI0028A95FFB|nr:hypothetical protein [Tissierella sp.]
MSFDIEVLVIEQKGLVPIPFVSKIEVLNELEHDIVMRFTDTWKFMSQLKGIWYSLVKEDDGIKNAFLLCESDFEIEPEKLPIPLWIDNKDVIYNLTPLIINKDYISDFEEILKFLLEQSPINTIMFLAKYQGGDYEIVEGILPFNDFIIKLKDRKILFNICYLVTKN